MSASRRSQSLRLSSALKIEEEAMVTKNQGIGTILGSDSERSNKAASSLRRTLSADMSSTKWLTQYGSSPMKKIASSEEFSIYSISDTSSSEGEEEDYEDDRRESGTEHNGQFDFWSSLQEEVDKKKELEKPGQFDMWNSIISQKEKDPPNNSLQTPYIHPLVKRSASSLSKKSLEICTESLGSETGSDGFSSYQSSETGDADDDKEMEQEELMQQPQESQKRVEQSFDVDQEVRVPKYNYVFGKKSPQRSFPPPIPSLSRSDGASIRMQSRRDNGRLVLEAVSVPSTKNFRAERQDGRLVLSFVNSFSAEEVPKNEDEDKEEEELDSFEEEEGVEESEKESRREMEIEFVMEQAPKKSSPVINVHRLTLVMNKQMGLANQDPTWSKKFNEVVKFNEVGEIKAATMVAQSLASPPRIARLITTPPSAAAKVTTPSGATFNAYEYFWRTKPMSTGVVSKPMNQSAGNNTELILSNSLLKKEQQQPQQRVLVLSANKGEYLVPLSKGCKEPRRSLLFWEPRCIATS